MDLRYEAYCFADPLFFDEQRETRTPEEDFSTLLPLPGTGWVQKDLGVWRMLAPDAVALPGQGWKIHVSSGLDNAERILSRVYEYCVHNAVAFKHLRTKSILLARNSKYASRAASGKLITIYPADDDRFASILEELSGKLDGEPGPYILSDLRYGSGPLYARYGAFVEQWMEHGGSRVLAVTKPDGTKAPDRREPTFSVPEWVTLPACLEPHLAARRSGDPAQFPYRVRGSLHFSNGGGVYRAERLSDGKELVLKEARPHAGLDRGGVDAVERLRREHRVLTRLAGIDGVPEVYDLFVVWEHHFLAMQDVPGVPLGSWLARNYPLTRRDVGDDHVAAYTERALALLGSVERLLAEIHERGIVFGDLHPLNIIVESDDGAGGENGGDTVRLIDFELAFDVTEPGRPALGAPGFRAPADRKGFAIDEHALAALKLWLFLPLNALLELAPARLPGLVEFIERRFPLPSGFGDGIVRTLAPAAPVTPAPNELDAAEPDWGAVRKAIAEAILASATPERTDRLFPGDIEQFRVGGAGFAYGAAGVLHALHVGGAGRYPEHERWLLDSVRRDPPARPGLLDGAHGIAHVLENFGYRDEASELVSGAANLVEQTGDHGFESGLAGIGLNLLHLAESRGDAGFRAEAERIGDRLATTLESADGPADHARAGLTHGWSGPALLFVRLFERTGDRGWLALACRALERDLAECVPADDGSLQVRDAGTRTLPYVGVGSAGVALVAGELAEVDPDSAVAHRIPDLLQACRGEFVVHPGLLLGRCGLLVTLAAAHRRRPDADVASVVDMHLSRLRLHAVPFGPGGLAFPGNQLLRLSMDVATGGAGVLLALAAVQDGHGEALPFLGGPRRPQGLPADPRPEGK
ncbi:protein kinase-like protein [Prauserella shujinwangii]|uniref:Protein kinase-like protein n=1 Tax=Prauserella shujinwangii TaxID=1453103 RepID=A0A2T0LN00_9PSEU|nr:class III lanthionine synthetase LanKC [Prauserella shujinwangii]PRX44563.1 protein kinase-like protein [Prauserella shujinwangii]